VPQSSQDHTLAARVSVRVVDGASEVVGAGFLIGPDLVATCAHVVAAAIGADAYTAAAPSEEIRLDFPLLGESAIAVVHRWVPIEYDGTGDIAVLRVLGRPPVGTRMPPLRRIDQLWGDPFRVLGFPAGLVDGVWSTGQIRGAQGTRWFQLQTSVGDQPIVEGFSGAPVWHEGTGAVVGMTVASDRSETTTTAYLIPIEQILGTDPELLPCPYRGLEPFDEQHAEFFFGRDDDIAALVDAVAAHPLVTVAGPSGVGKSSLVRAGLIPRLRAAGYRIALLRPVPRQPVGPALSAELEDGEPAADVVLVVDQFEELAATAPEAARELLERVGELVRAPAPIKAVLTLRSATLDDVMAPQVAGLLSAGTVFLPPMARDQLRTAIVAPAERAPGLSFETGLIDRILDDAAAEPGQLPLVESLLTELWNRRDGGYLTLEAYQRAGGVAGVIANHAEAVIADFTDPDDESRLRRLFTALAAPDREGRFVRTPLSWADLAPDLRPLVQRLAAGRLLVIERTAGGAEHVQLAHQALVAHWPRLRDWLTEDRDFLAWRAQLDQQRERWEATDRDDGGLLRGTALAAAREWLPARSADVSAAGQEYVRRSHARQRREVRRWRLVTAVLGVLVLAAGALSVVTTISRNEVGERLRLANAELIAQSALTNELADPVTATALALAAWRADPHNTTAQTAMLRMSMAMRSADQVFPAVVDEPVPGFGSSEDGDTIVVREGPGIVVLTGARGTALQRWVVPDVPPGLDRYILSTDGRHLAAIGESREVYVWDVAARRGPALVESAAGRVDPVTVSISSDSRRLHWLADTPAGTELVIRNIAGNRPVSHGLGPITDDRVTGVFLTADPRVAIEVANADDGLPGRVTARSLIDGSVMADFPPDTALTGGDLTLSCAPDTGSQAVVRSAITGQELRRVDLLTQQCTDKYLRDRQSADGPYLMEPRAATKVRDSDVYRITALHDGRTFDLTAPPSSLWTQNIPISNLARTALASDDRVDVLLPSGTSIMRLRGVADTGGVLPNTPWAVGLSSDQRFQVAISPDSYAVLEPGTRNVLGSLQRAALQVQGEQHELVDSDRLTIRTKAGDYWAYVEYGLPSLSVIDHYATTPADGEEPPDNIAISATVDHVAFMARGLIGVFDRNTGKPVGAPIRLADNPERGMYFATAQPKLDLRPGAAGQVAVVGPDAVELWNPVTGVREGAIRLPRTITSEIVVDSTGTRAALGGVDSVHVLDLERQIMLTEPLLLTSPSILKGFTEDGNIAVLLQLDDDEYGLSIWNPSTRREVGPLRLSAVHDIGSTRTHGGQLMAYGLEGALPLMLQLTPTAWSEQLCRITNRAFTDVERALIPEGTGVDSPCA
jgi:hypothetical protein